MINVSPQPQQGNPGLSSNVQDALARRGTTPEAGQAGAGSLTQTSPAAAMANPSPQSVPFSQMGHDSARSTPQMAPGQKFTPATKEDAIIAALIEKTKNHDKLQMEQKIGRAHV